MRPLAPRLLASLRRPLAGAGLAFLGLSTAGAASLGGLAVDVVNESEPVLCAEKDNVALSMAHPAVRSLRIEAAHPVYLAPGLPDQQQGTKYVIDEHVVEGKRHLFEIKPEPTRRRESA